MRDDKRVERLVVGLEAGRGVKSQRGSLFTQGRLRFHHGEKNGLQLFAHFRAGYNSIFISSEAQNDK